jgi:2,3-bisphosphoglycerate-independent phosphoglycerate mutase
MADWKLKPHQTIPPPEGPVLVCVLDGFGVNKEDEYNAVYVADTPVYDKLRSTAPDRFR